MKKLIIRILMKLYAPLLNELRPEISKIQERVERIESNSINLDKQIKAVNDITRANHDGIHDSTRDLYRLRKTAGYNKAFAANPLISVRIATYNRSNDLINVAISSVLKQTYKNFEIVVVGDHCTDDTEKKIKGLNDKRIRFYNLPNRINYPQDPVKKWRVIGTPAINAAAAMAKGEWVAALDDDDEFSPDHLEKLIKHTQETRCELVYGASDRKNLSTKKTDRIWSFPPERGQFTFHGAIYMRALDDIFKYDFKSWVMEEVNDWNMCRRMMESGVRISAIEDVIGTIYYLPAGHPKKDY